VLAEHRSYISSLVFTPDGRRLISHGADNALCIWDIATGTLIAKANGGKVVVPGSPYRIALTPDGRQIVCPYDSRLQLYDAQDIGEVKSLALPTQNTRLAVYSPDGTTIAVAGSEPEVYLLESRNGTVLRLLKGHKEAVHWISFNADGSRIVTASSDSTVRLWDAVTGELLQVFRRHTDEVFSAVFHPDGKRIASAGRDRVIRIWNPESGAEVARLQGHNNYVFSLAFSPDGRTLLSGSGDYTARLWDTFPISRRLLARTQKSEK
jgi:WD40 repeat protein